MTVTVDEHQNINGGSLSLIYDSDVLEIKSGKWIGSIKDDAETATYKVDKNQGAYAFPSPETVVGDVFSVTFTVKSDAAYGASVTVKAEVKYEPSFGSIYSEEVTVGTVTITCPHTNTENIAEQPATCKDVGYTAGVYCKDCETYISGHEEIPKSTEHSYGSWTSVSDKKHSRTCSVCGNVETRSHVFDQKTATEGFLASPATCTKVATYYIIPASAVQRE